MTCPERRALGRWWEDSLGDPEDCTFPIAPINTYTNVAYVLVGIFSWPVSWAFGLAMILLGVGSGLYHGFKTVSMDRLDNAGMYLVYGGLVVYSMAPGERVTPFVMLGIGALLAWRFAFLAVPDDVETILLGAFVAFVTLTVALHGHPWLALLSLSILGLSYILWWADVQRNALLARCGLKRWGHGLWHLGTAVGTYLSFRGLA